ncbi:sugar kinase [Microbacterium sp. MPKO10]|uniref:sugar kinase n=1 Tax=Microbacterium sp. MPKO10 TaxID=2989818 RepID=UPI00223635D3|nr:sugar kinase [Microbacterium sp. MPKO10]MCW4459786.1 sugar kinase [Microbacterium sp. MPKO10]
MATYDVTAFGEGGIRLSVPVGDRIDRVSSFEVGIAGTEANVLAGLSSLGWSTSWISSLPDSALGRRVETQLRSYGVDLGGVHRVPGARLGTYYVEYSGAPRPTQVTFDRADTAFTRMQSADVDWDRMLDTRVLHLTGLTAALSDSALAITAEAFTRAKAAGATVSFDVNYRKNLWSCEAAAQALRPFIEDADILFCRYDDARDLYGLQGESDSVVAQLSEMSNASTVLMSRSGTGAWAAIDGVVAHTPAFPVDIVDRLGAGDGFAAGYLHSWLNGDRDNAVASGCAMAALALSQYGEQVVTTRDELRNLITDPGRSLSR